MGAVHLFGLLLVLTNSSKYSTGRDKNMNSKYFSWTEVKFLERQIFLFLNRGRRLASSAIPSQSLAKHDSRSEFGHKSNSNHMLSKLKMCFASLWENKHPNHFHNNW